jgi:hypothetical protein
MKQVIISLFLLFISGSLLSQKTVHVFVALCDNKHQGIVPVPAKIGNGQDPHYNLYWGAGYGVKNYFHRKSADWNLIKTIKNPDGIILERLIFKHSRKNVYLLADAYDGSKIKNTVYDFLRASSGEFISNIYVNDTLQMKFGGRADLCAYVGHNGLMDFNADIRLKNMNQKEKDVIIIGCFSKQYFEPYIKECGANPLLWSTHLMSAEAYTLEWALDAWVLNEADESVRLRAAKAYNHYQKCGLKPALNLLVTGW